MAGSLNRVMLIGNLVADPEIRRLNSGDPVVNLRVATNDTWRDKNTGERKEKAEFHNVVIFNDQIAKVAEAYLRKGVKVYVEGSLQTREYEKSGETRRVTEIVLQKFRGELQMLDKSDGDRREAPADPHGTFSRVDNQRPSAPDDSEIPF